MANEITITGSISVDVGDLSFSKQFTSSYDATQERATLSPQTVGTTHELLALGDVATPGPFFLVNLDDTNYFELGKDDGGSFVPDQKCAAGKHISCSPASGVTYYVRANTAPVNILPFIPDVA